jgi:hypothetical protein
MRMLVVPVGHGIERGQNMVDGGLCAWMKLDWGPKPGAGAEALAGGCFVGCRGVAQRGATGKARPELLR